MRYVRLEASFLLSLPIPTQGQPHALLTQDEVYGSLITRFFDTHHYPELGWIHNIACKQYGEAAEALAQVLDEGEGKEESGELDFRKVVHLILQYRFGPHEQEKKRNS